MANTDKRFQPARFRGAPSPIRSAAKGGTRGLAERKKLMAASEEKNSYNTRVVVAREKTARE